MTCGIYKIINLKNGKIYIGSSSNIERRWNAHKNQLKFMVGRAMRKYGVESFELHIIERCLEDSLLSREQYYLDTEKPFGKRGYNMCKEAGSTRGSKWSEERRKQQKDLRIKLGFGKWNKGRKAWNKGKAWKGQVKEKISESRQGKMTGSSNHKSKTCAFISPNGYVEEGVSINSFAVERNLSPQALWMVFKGQRNSHKGWTKAY